MSSKLKQTKIRILKSTLALLEASNGKDVRMSDIAKKAGVSRQAVYLHFANRAELLIETTLYLDDIKQTDLRLEASRGAKSGLKRMDAFIAAWGSYLPEIYGVAKALIAMSDHDKEAEKAWKVRMQDMREGCLAAIQALDRDGKLVSDFSAHQATDILWMLLSVRNWEQLTQECGWSQDQYIEKTQLMARHIFVRH